MKLISPLIIGAAAVDKSSAYFLKMLISIKRNKGFCNLRITKKMNSNNSTKFPLYDNLAKDVPNTDLTKKQKKELIAAIESIDDHGCELIYALIRMHEVENSSSYGCFKLPYSGVFIEDVKIVFDIEQFPNKLKRIIFNFVNMHSLKMKEDLSNLNVLKNLNTTAAATASKLEI